jgi:carboxyl-terminal processing protease
VSVLLLSRAAKRTFCAVVLVAASSGAFQVGQRLASETGRPLREIGHLISATAGDRGPFGAISGDTQQDNNVPPADIFETVLDHVKRDFVENNGGDQHLSNGALSQMFASLDDPRTNFLDAETRKARQAALEGRYYGIGAVFAITKVNKQDIDYRYLTVMDVMPGSPAEKSGLRSGDRITEVDGHWIIAYSITNDVDRIRKEGDKDDAARRSELNPIVDRFKAGYTVPKALDRLAQGEGKTYKVTVERSGHTTPLKVDMTTALTVVDPVTYRVIDGHVGYLRVRQFNQRASDDFGKALDGVNADIKGLVLDLRQNPGGVTAEAATGVDGYTSARALIARLTPGGKVATIERKPNHREPLMVEPAAANLHLPLVVLVDAGTANLSEMVAAALRDAGKAKIVGAHTFGDDVLQLFAPLKNGSGVEIATAHLRTAAGVDLDRGISPDILVNTISTDTSGKDRALDRAVATVTAGA